MDRISWLDYGKCICMLLVIYSHTVYMYTGSLNVFLELMTPTRLIVFFFISGYLIKIDKFDFKRTMISIVKKLLFPYLLFTSIIFIPKHLAHGTELSISAMLYEILGGYASWFVAALAVSKITLSLCIKYIKNNILLLGIVCIILAVSGFILTQYVTIPIPWYAHYGLISLIYLYLGILYKKYEDILSKRIKLQAIISIVLYAICVSLDFFYFKNSTFYFALKPGEVSILGIFSFLILSLLGIWMMVSIVKLIPNNVNWMLYIGKNSLTHYYLNTGLLLVLITIINKIGIEYNSLYVYPLFVVVVITLNAISKLILRFAPWMVGNFKNSSNK